MSNADPVHYILKHLTGVKETSSGRWQACCPAHKDIHASLSISQGDGGRALVHCHAGCALSQVLAKIGLTESDLFARTTMMDNPGCKTPLSTEAREVRSYETPDDAIAAVEAQINGEHVDSWSYPGDSFRVARFALRSGGKTYRPIHREEEGWKVGDPPGPLPLYRGNEFPNGGPVVVVEGEKVADAACKVGLPAVTSAHGAKSAKKSDWGPLAGRDVTILPDNDEAGRRYAQDVAEILTSLDPPAVVRIIELPGLGEHGDRVDWVDPDGQMGCRSAEEIQAAILSMAQATMPWTPPSAKSLGGEPVTICLADVTPEAIKWLWPSRFALGKLALIAGDPGLGKSFITLDMAARVSRGTSWPDCPDTCSPPGGVVLLNAEDDLADTIRPRLDAAGADVERIVALKAVRRIDVTTSDERQDPFNLIDDLSTLEETIRQIDDCRLVVIDPISAYLGRTDSHRNAEIRGLLAPLSELAARHSVAVIAVTHLRKGEGPALYRAMGSLAFVACARASYCVARDRDDPTEQRRLFLPMKNNLSSDHSGLAYSLDNTLDPNGQPVVKWEAEPVSISADQVLNDTYRRNGEADSPALGDAKEWLKQSLAHGPRPAKNLITQSEQDGISRRTLYRAKKALGIVASKDGFEEGWTWRLPESLATTAQPEDSPAEDPQGPKHESLATFGNLGNLREKSKELTAFSDASKADAAEDCQPAGSGDLRPDPNQPGPVDLLTPPQRERYMAIYLTRSSTMPPAEKHARSWRAALRAG